MLQALRGRRNDDVTAAYGLVNDVLIALSARSVGAIVVTQNGEDYRVIQDLRRFELQVL